MRQRVFQGGHEVGELYGDKVLTAYHGMNTHGHHTWMWKCSCGNTYGPDSLTHVKRYPRCQQCSLKRENNPRWKGHQDIPGTLLTQYRRDASKKGREFSVSPQDLWDIWEAQDGKCAYTGWELSFGYKSETTASIDRIDSSGGYTLGNVQWVHKDVNRMKTDFPEDRFLQICRAVAR